MKISEVCLAIFRREFLSYFRSPVAYVFICIFLISSVGCTFFLGQLYESNQASLAPFFTYLPWLYLVLVPAVGMRLWAEERRGGTIELLMTLPVTLTEAVIAKFFAGWAFIGIALVLTLPLALTVNYLGDADNGVILAGYVGSFLMAGAYLSVTCLTSALTKNQVVAFILSVVACFLGVLIGWGIFSDTLLAIFPVFIVDAVTWLGFMGHFQAMSRGVIDLRDIIYFATVILLMLSLNVIVLESKKAS